jgi:hypothetical protein
MMHAFLQCAFLLHFIMSAFFVMQTHRLSIRGALALSDRREFWPLMAITGTVFI